MVKNLPDNVGDATDADSTPGLERTAGGGNGNPLQYSCLGNPMDRGAWVGCSPRGHKESGMTDNTQTQSLQTHLLSPCKPRCRGIYRYPDSISEDQDCGGEHHLIFKNA